tara:strand:- start:311 stop:625 length:315 start_codon:yes stop_codon:yes gene_type:complete
MLDDKSMEGWDIFDPWLERLTNHSVLSLEFQKYYCQEEKFLSRATSLFWHYYNRYCVWEDLNEIRIMMADLKNKNKFQESYREVFKRDPFERLSELEEEIGFLL